MTPRQMQIAFSQYFERDVGSFIDIESDEIFMWLNLAQEEFIKNRFSRLNLQRRGFEQSQERLDDLSLFVESNLSISTEHNENNSPIYKDKFFSDLALFPANYLHLINIRGTIRWNIPSGEIIIDPGPPPFRTTNTTTEPVKTVNIKLSQQDDVWRLLEDPFNRTTHKEPIATIDNIGIYIYSDSTFIVESIFLTYVKVPQEIILTVDGLGDQACELPDFLHREIVDMAVRMYKQNSGRLTPQEILQPTS